MSIEAPHQPEGLNLDEHTPAAIDYATREVMGIMHAQSSTGRTDSENDVFLGYLTQMKNLELTPAETISLARTYADSRQDGHGGGIIQD